MSIDIKKTPILFSVGTHIAYQIAEKYFDKTHYVWCTSNFHSLSQPPTSNPKSIYRRFIEQIINKDRHSVEIENNITGLLHGIEAKYKSKVITKDLRNALMALLANSTYRDFLPVIYIIPIHQMCNYEKRIKEVPKKYKASDSSVEYLIEDLSSHECYIIDLSDIYLNVHFISDGKVGS